MYARKRRTEKHGEGKKKWRVLNQMEVMTEHIVLEYTTVCMLETPTESSDRINDSLHNEILILKTCSNYNTCHIVYSIIIISIL